MRYDDRVERVTRQLYLLRLSHDRLEQELMSRPTTMRDALAQLRAQLRGLRGDRARARLPGAPEVLQFLAQHCQLEQAAIYAIDNAAPSADGVPTFTRAAVLGTPPALQPDDPLLAYVLDSGELAHVQVEGLTESLPTQQIVVCPIQTSDKRLLGVLAVNRIPFFALNTEQLQLMRVLTGAYADGVVMTPALLAIQRALPDAPEDFADELARAERIQREFAISSHIVVMLFGDVPLAQDAFQLVLRQRRAPDVVWTPTRAEHKAVFVNLLPVSGTAAVEGYLVRTENAIRENFATDLQTLRVRSFTISLADPDPAAALSRVLATGVR